MAHYAFLDLNNVVTEVIVGKEEGEDNTNWEHWYGNFRGQTCKRTSYNTVANVHREGGTPFRKNFAGVGYTYDATRDAFIPPKPFPSWTLNEVTCNWDAPTSMPNDGKLYLWNEEQLAWVEIV